jgi:hypothetical protein
MTVMDGSASLRGNQDTFHRLCSAHEDGGRSPAGIRKVGGDTTLPVVKGG